jgi:hypothetical protein
MSTVLAAVNNNIMRPQTQNKQSGFILFYTVIIISVVLVTAGIFVETVLKEAHIARDEMESLKAFYAADAGIECARFLQSELDAFDTTRARSSSFCWGTSNSRVTYGMNPATEECVAHEYHYELGGFDNNACVEMTVDVTPREITAGGDTFTVCDALVVSSGKNSCAEGADVVERTRWEDM